MHLNVTYEKVTAAKVHPSFHSHFIQIEAIHRKNMPKMMEESWCAVLGEGELESGLKIRDVEKTIIRWTDIVQELNI